MYCKAITKTGTPCIRKIKCGKYCTTHKGEYEDCPICYDDMQAKTVLKCGHSFCIACISKCEKSCPLCRQETNEFPTKFANTLRIISSKKYSNIRLSEENSKKKVKQWFDLVMTVHYKVLIVEEFRNVFFEKIKYLSTKGMEMNKFIKQIESFKQRMNIA